MKQYWVYIAWNGRRALYTGVTNSLERRAWQHKSRSVSGFTAKYRIDRIVYYEATLDVKVAIGREKQIKGWRREKKIRLIESMNPQWRNLSADWAQVSPTGDDSSSLRSSE
ncbi:MAG: GIY-YIG nuclease family protein [Thermoanaerobaculia bacterium]